MNVIGLTQGAGIDLFLNLVDALKVHGLQVDKVGAWTSYAKHFRRSEAVSQLGKDVQFVKEWDVLETARSHTPNYSRLKEFESELAPGALWNCIIADRRIIYGSRSKFTEDTRVRYSDRHINAILDIALVEIKKLFDEIQPQAVIGFTPVTFGEVLIAEFARSKNIPCLMLHSSRIRNYFAFFDTLIGTSNHFLKLMDQDQFTTEVRQTAADILKETKKDGVIYEGVNLGLRKGRPFRPIKAAQSLPRAIASEVRRATSSELRRDQHDPGALAPWFYQFIHQPMRAKRVARFLKNSGRLIDGQDISRCGPFAFYPMHSEPEVALQVLGRPYHKNQIELVRNLAASLPVGYKLLVKEHPRSFGLRPPHYYRRLIEIPNLRFVATDVPSMYIVPHSALVAVISSTIGLEAAISGVPVLMLGHPKYSALPSNMAKKCYNLFELPAAVQDLLTNYKYDEPGMLKLLSALVAGSVNIDVYSVLLNKPDRYFQGREHMSRQDRLKQDYDRLAKYTINRVAEL